MDAEEVAGVRVEAAEVDVTRLEVGVKVRVARAEECVSFVARVDRDVAQADTDVDRVDTDVAWAEVEVEDMGRADICLSIFVFLGCTEIII